MISGAEKIYDVSGVEVCNLLPQQPPFVMVDRMTYLDTATVVTTLTIIADNLFCNDGQFSAYGMIENIAQTCAVRIGYLDSLQRKPIRIGYIGAIRKLNMIKHPLVGETITTTIHVEEEVFNLTLITAKVCVEETCVLSCEMKIALSETNE